MLKNGNKEIINRLISILNLKKYSCQMKLAEYDKIESLRDNLIKYEDNPSKGLIELNDKKLIDLFLEFTKNKYTADELEVYKYWINEGYANPLLKDSSQYKESYKIFNDLIDRIQVYLDYTRTFDLNKELIINDLNLIDSLKEKIVNNVVVIDFTPYYSLFIANETITFDDIYNYIISICDNNLYLINNGIKYSIKNEVNNDVVKDISNKLCELIDNMKNNELSNNYILDKINELSNIISKLEKNIDFLYDIYPSNIINVMTGIWDEEDIEYYKERLAIPITLIKGKIKGLDMKLSKEDSIIISEFLDDLKDKLNKLKKEENKYNDNILQNNKTIKKLNDINTLLLDNKLPISGEDIKVIVDSIKTFSNDYKYIINVLNELNNLNLKRLYNNESILSETENKEVVVDRRELKKLEILFNKYNYNFESFPKRYIDELVNNGEYEHIREIIEYINTIDKFSFIKEFINIIGNDDIDKDLKELRAYQICYILAYSDINIISNLVKICDTDNINLYDIFSIPKVFSSKKNKKMPGVYENFIANELYIKEEYPELLIEFMNNYPTVFGTDSDLFKKNIDLTKAYGLKINKNKDFTIPSPLALQTPDFEYVIDRYIEINKYDLVEKYRNLLGTNNINDISERYKEEKGIDIEKNKYFKLKKVFSSDINKYLSGLSVENIPVALSDSLIKKLDKINEEKDEDLKNVQYLINGVYISKIKTLKYYSTLLINKYKDKKEALLFSMTKDSFLTEEEFNLLKSAI